MSFIQHVECVQRLNIPILLFYSKPEETIPVFKRIQPNSLFESFLTFILLRPQFFYFDAFQDECHELRGTALVSNIMYSAKEFLFLPGRIIIGKMTTYTLRNVFRFTYIYYLLLVIMKI